MDIIGKMYIIGQNEQKLDTIGQNGQSNKSLTNID